MWDTSDAARARNCFRCNGTGTHAVYASRKPAPVAPQRCAVKLGKLSKEEGLAILEAAAKKSDKA